MTETRSALRRFACRLKSANCRVQGEHVAKWLHHRLAGSPLSRPKATALMVSESGQPFLSGFGNSLRNTSLADFSSPFSCFLENALSLREGILRLSFGFPTLCLADRQPEALSLSAIRLRIFFRPSANRILAWCSVSPRSFAIRRHE